MKVNKITIYITVVLTIIAVLLCFKLYGCNSIVYDLSLACLGSLLVSIVVSTIAYSVERRHAMEQFWSACLDSINMIRRIEYFECNEPKQLIRDALYEEKDYHGITPHDHEAKDKLKAWIEENEFYDDGREQYDEFLEAHCSLIIDNYYKLVIKCSKNYIDFSEFNVRELTNAYGNLDFIFGNNTVRKEAYNNLYSKITVFHNKCQSKAFSFKQFMEGKGNIAICFDMIVELDSQLYTQKKNSIYASFADDLDKSLEVFRSKIYFSKPEFSMPIPINETIIFDNTNTTQIPKTDLMDNESISE